MCYDKKSPKSVIPSFVRHTFDFVIQIDFHASKTRSFASDFDISPFNGTIEAVTITLAGYLDFLIL